MRLIWAMLLAAAGLTASVAAPAWAAPMNCPPMCDRIPDSAWIDATEIPLYREYRWPQLAGLAVTTVSPRFRFEEDCALPLLPDDPRHYAVSARVEVDRPVGHWQLQVQVIHWRGETWRGGQHAMAAVRASDAAIRACQLLVPASSPSITTGEPGRLAAVISFPDRVLRQYLLADANSSTVVELAMWSTTPPQVPWPPVADSQVLDALAAPLCDAYLGSCR
ncbi:ATPase [Mycolicibacterium goodii]|nr:ATPase [Mycolicibacterium goodii]MBU8810929.1 ATPase [Mycolicibacterium goodii]MBU8816007.1 ATPase [Mycolicibacterium goodii]PJK21975.1 ATPase [Mycolicibacterium goodii]